MMLNTKISAFKTVDSFRPHTVALAAWIRSIMHPDTRPDLCALIADVLAAKGEKAQKAAKLKLPAITPGAICEGGHGLHRVKVVTGLMQFDIDPKDNPHLPGGSALRAAVANLDEVLFAALSTRGTGCWGIVRVPVIVPDYAALDDDERGVIVDDWRARFDQLRADFAKFGVNLDDKGGAPSDLRYWAPDPDAYLNPDAVVYMGKAVITPAPAPNKGEPVTFKAAEPGPGARWTHARRLQALAETIIKDEIDITAQNHPVNDWLAIAYDVAGVEGEAGRALFHAVSSIYTGYDEAECNDVYNSALRRAKPGTVPKAFYKFAKQAGLSFMADAPEKRRTKTPVDARTPAKAYTDTDNLRRAEGGTDTPLILTKYTQ